MRRTGMLTLAGLAIAGLALAAPAARGGLGRALTGVTEEARRRLAAFRADMARREADLRAGLLPPDDAVASARAHRTDTRRP